MMIRLVLLHHLRRSYQLVLIAIISTLLPKFAVTFLNHQFSHCGGAGRVGSHQPGCGGSPVAIDLKKSAVLCSWADVTRSGSNNNRCPPERRCRNLNEELSRSRRLSFFLGMSQNYYDDDDDSEKDEENNADDEDGSNDNNNLLPPPVPGTSIPSSRSRKRDTVLKWITPGSRSSDASSQMVRPIRLEDGSIIEEEEDDSEPKRVRMNFDGLFAGMPGLDSILGVSDDEHQQKSEKQSSSSTTNKAPSSGRSSRSGAGRISSVGTSLSTSRGSGSSSSSDGDGTISSTRKNDWFEDEKRRIQDYYRQIINDMYSQIETQRTEDPDNVPENAEAIMRDAIRQEMDAEIEAKKQEFERKQMEEYEIERKRFNEEADVSEESRWQVQELIDKDIEIQRQVDESQIQMDEFLKYEEEATIRYEQQVSEDDSTTNTVAGTSSIQEPKENEDLDQWALERLRDMAESSSDVSYDVTDILDENIDDLEDRMQKESLKKLSSIQPDSLKEWQMYRSIATKLGEGSGGSDENDGENKELEENDEENEEIIAAKLQSWKEYLLKEEEIRKESGLTRGPKLPFEWHEYEEGDDGVENNNGENNELSSSTRGLASQTIENRRNINKMSIEAMENIIAKGMGGRSEELKNQVESLKSLLESQDYLDVDASYLLDQNEEETNVDGPVDLSDVFQSSSSAPIQEEQQGQKPSIVAPLERDINYRPVAGASTGSINEADIPLNTEQTYPQQSPPPDTPFFSQDRDADDWFSEETTDMRQPGKQEQPPNTPFFSTTEDIEEEMAPPPPNTPFFSSADNDVSSSSDDYNERYGVEEDPSASDGGDEEFSYKLGTIEEQKLRAMYQRAGARTKADQEAIRSQWEEFQQFEKAKRELSGLDMKSNENDDTKTDDMMINQANINYEMSDVIKADGDIDADKILSSIGPRPTRQKNKDSTSIADQTEGDEETTAASEEEEFRVPESNLDPTEVNDSLYRSVSAIGGGRTKDDPTAKRVEQTAYLEFKNQEDELRKSLDELDKEIENEFSTNKAEGYSFNATEYVEDAIDSLGPRPQPKRRRIIDVDDYDSDRGGALDNDDPESFTEDVDDDFVPGWLRKERESARSQDEGGSSSSSSIGESRKGNFLGNDIDDVFDDDIYEHNMRQLAEYERRRAGNKKQMGIDISDILGRTSDDYADYTYDNNFFQGSNEEDAGGWGTASFEARKRNLLDYTELDLVEVNSVMEHKDSVYATGVSQYIRRINKPFREFGAIFRLEGVLVDITGFQWEAWKIVAEKYKFKPPEIDDVRRASVLPSHIAIRQVFYWTEDLILCRDASATHRDALRDVFNRWIEENSSEKGVRSDGSSSGSNNKGSLGIGQELFDDAEEEYEPSPSARITTAPIFSQKTTEEEKINILAEAWSKTAIEYNLTPPTLEQVIFAVAVSPDIAVREAFQWSRDLIEVEKFVLSYQNNLQALNSGGCSDNYSDSVTGAVPTSNGVPKRKKTRRLDENSMMEIQYKVWTTIAKENAFDEPEPDEVMAAFVINDPMIAIREGFGWTEDPKTLGELVESYNTLSKDFVDKWMTAGDDKYENRGMSRVESSTSVGTATTTSSTITAGDNFSLASHGMMGPSPEEVLEIQAYAWRLAAEMHGFESPSLDEIKLATNVPSMEAIQKLFEWSTNEELCRSITSAYEVSLKDRSKKLMEKYGLEAENIDSTISVNENSADDLLDGDDIFQTVSDAWAAVARRYGFDEPEEEQLLFAMSVGPEEAIMTGFEWKRKDELDEVAKLVDEYKNELKGKRAALGLSATASSPSSSPILSQPKRKVQPNTDKIFQAVFDAWTVVANKFAYGLPSEEQILFAMSVGPEEAIVTGFQWEDSPDEISKLVMEYKNELGKRRATLIKNEGALSRDDYIRNNNNDDSLYWEDMEEEDEEEVSIPLFQVMPGASKWVKSLLDVEMACGVVSYLDHDQVETLLREADMLDFIGPDKRVTASNGYRRDQDQLLGAALRLERRPDHCVVFDSTSSASDAAHDVDMRSVSVIGPFPRYDLLAADSTASSFTDLTAMNIRRLFGERIYDQPQMDVQQAEPDKTRKTRTAFFWDDDV